VFTTLRRSPDSKKVSGKVASYTSSAWNHIVTVVDFDQTNDRTSVTGYSLAVLDTTATYDDFLFIDTAASEASLGAYFSIGR
jgi:hypothetical protein